MEGWSRCLPPSINNFRPDSGGKLVPYGLEHVDDRRLDPTRARQQRSPAILPSRYECGYLFTRMLVAGGPFSLVCSRRRRASFHCRRVGEWLVWSGYCS